MKFFAIILFLWDSGEVVKVDVIPVEVCPEEMILPSNNTWMCVEFNVPAPGEPV